MTWDKAALVCFDAGARQTTSQTDDTSRWGKYDIAS
jgi:hypothetical protein